MRPVPPHALALTRIAIGLFLLVYAGLYVPHIALLFSDHGIALPLYLDQHPALSLILAPQPPIIARAIYVLLLLSILGITLGAQFRFSTLLTILGGLYFWQLQLHLFPASYNRILFFTLIVLLFSGAHRTLSVDQRLRSGSFFHWEPTSILPQRLIALQITMTFLGVSLQKWWLPGWKGGEILAYSYLSRWATPLAHWYAQLPFTLRHYDFIVLVVKIGQPVCALGLWVSKPAVRISSVVFLSVFLLLITVMMSIWWFVFIIPAFILFWKPEEVGVWFCRGMERMEGLRVQEKPAKPGKPEKPEKPGKPGKPGRPE